MKKSIVVLTISVVFASLQAVTVAPLFTDASSQETFVSHNPAVQLGAPNRDSSAYAYPRYRSHWHLGRRYPRWSDEQRPKHWRQGSLPTKNAQKFVAPTK